MTGAVFPLVPSRRVVGLAFGGMRSARRGGGSDVAGSRLYRPGDDVARIDWAASARLSTARGHDEFVVREHFTEESPRVVVAADLGPTMSLAAPPRRRLHKAAVSEVVSRLIADSAKAAHGTVAFPDYGGSVSTSLDLLERQRRDLPAGTFVFVVSDFLDPPSRDAWLRALGHRWDVIPVVIQDPVWERSFPDIAGVVVPLAEARTGKVSDVRLTAAETQERRRANEARWERLLVDFRSAGLTPVVLGSDDPAGITGAFLSWADDRLSVRGRA